MAKKKKVTRKQLLKEPDEFLTFSARLIQFITHYRFPILILISTLIIGAMAISGIRLYIHKMERLAFSSFAAAKNEYQSVSDQMGPSAAYKAIQGNIEQVIDRYGNRKGGKFALLFYANISYRNGDFKKAIDLYQQVLVGLSNPFIRSQVLTSLGYAHEANREYPAARNYFEMVSQSADPVLRGEALYHLSRIYDVMGESEKSRELLKKISQDHPKSVYIDLINERAGI